MSATNKSPESGPESTGRASSGVRSDVWPLSDDAVADPTPAAFAIHDAKNMAGVLSANLEVLRRALDPALIPPSAAGALEDAQEAARRLTGLLREALTGLQGQEPLRITPRSVRVAPIVKAAVERMQSAANSRGVRIVETGAIHALATIEPDLLERIVCNLLENAVRFSRSGDTVELEYESRHGRLTLAVGDRGPGVPEQAREQIFESFRRRGPSGSGQHFGLGLAFCREVARAHGGDAWVFNRGQGGACFVVEIE